MRAVGRHIPGRGASFYASHQRQPATFTELTTASGGGAALVLADGVTVVGPALVGASWTLTIAHRHGVGNVLTANDRGDGSTTSGPRTFQRVESGKGRRTSSSNESDVIT